MTPSYFEIKKDLKIKSYLTEHLVMTGFFSTFVKDVVRPNISTKQHNTIYTIPSIKP